MAMNKNTNMTVDNRVNDATSYLYTNSPLVTAPTGKIVYDLSPNSRRRLRTNDIDHITLHIQDIKEPIVYPTAIFKDPSGSASTYAVFANGTTAQYIPEWQISAADAASGSIKGNRNSEGTLSGCLPGTSTPSNYTSVSIEIANISPERGYQYPISTETYKSTIDLISDIAYRNNFGEVEWGKNIFGHCDYNVGKVCPGDFIMNNREWIVHESNKVLKAVTRKYGVFTEENYQEYLNDRSKMSDEEFLKSINVNLDYTCMSNVKGSEKTPPKYTASKLQINNYNQIVEYISAVNTSLKKETGTYKGATNSDTSIPTEMNNVMNSILGLSSELSGKISTDLENILSIAKTLKDMDDHLSGEQMTQIEEYLNFYKPEFEFKPIWLEGGLTIGSEKGKLDINDLQIDESIFENLITDTTATKSSIEKLQESIKSLEGDVWDEVNWKLVGYNEALDDKLTSINLLHDEMSKVYNTLKQWMEEDPSITPTIDMSKIEEFKEDIEKLNKEIEELKLKKEEKVTETIEEDGEEKKQEKYKYTETERNGFQQQIEDKEKLITEKEKLIEKINELPEMIKKAEDELNTTIEEIYTGFGEKATQIISGKKVSYVRFPEMDEAIEDLEKPAKDPEPTTPYDGGGGGGGGGGGKPNPGNDKKQNKEKPSNEPKKEETQPTSSTLDYVSNDKNDNIYISNNINEEELPIDIEDELQDEEFEDLLEEDFFENNDANLDFSDLEFNAPQDKKSSSKWKIAGMIAGAAGITGASVLGLREYKKSKKNNEFEEDYELEDKSDENLDIKY